MSTFIPLLVNFVIWFLIGMGAGTVYFYLKDRRPK